jgi:hypothetical protein
MGQSTDAYTFYGYCWAEEVDSDFPGNMNDWAEAELKASGHADPWERHPGGQRPDWVAENTAAIDAWYAAKRDLVDALPFDWGSHCSSDEPMPYLFIKDTQTVADWGDPQPMPSGDVDPEWKPKLDAFLESQGIEPPEGENQPGWWVASWWG